MIIHYYMIMYMLKKKHRHHCYIKGNKIQSAFSIHYEMRSFNLFLFILNVHHYFLMLKPKEKKIGIETHMYISYIWIAAKITSNETSYSIFRKGLFLQLIKTSKYILCMYLIFCNGNGILSRPIFFCLGAALYVANYQCIYSLLCMYLVLCDVMILLSRPICCFTFELHVLNPWEDIFCTKLSMFIPWVSLLSLAWTCLGQFPVF